jgi:hypothetical protein
MYGSEFWVQAYSYVCKSWPFILPVLCNGCWSLNGEYWRAHKFVNLILIHRHIFPQAVRWLSFSSVKLRKRQFSLTASSFCHKTPKHFYFKVEWRCKYKTGLLYGIPFLSFEVLHSMGKISELQVLTLRRSGRLFFSATVNTFQGMRFCYYYSSR